MVPLFSPRQPPPAGGFFYVEWKHGLILILMQNHILPHIKPRVAAIRKPPKQPLQNVLEDFIRTLKNDNINVQGILQKSVSNPDGSRLGVDGVDILTLERIALLRPTPYETNNKLCSLNLAELSAATQIIRHAVETQADIAIVERYGKTEADGGGLADDLLALMSSGIPTLVLVSHDHWEAWQEFSGGLAETLKGTSEALLGWWNGIQP